MIFCFNKNNLIEKDIKKNMNKDDIKLWKYLLTLH